MKANPLEALQESTLTGDGGMGTQLIEMGMSAGECGMLWNAARPHDIAAIHRAYRAAGSRLLTSNSFGGTRSMLERHGEGGRVAELNRAAARIASEAAGGEAWVLGDVGPFGDFLEPLGDTEPDELRDIFSEQMRALADGGADIILLETMSDPGEVEVGIEAARTVCELPVMVSYAFQRAADGSFRTMMGNTVEDCLNRALAGGAQIVGANCGTDLGLDDYRELAEALVAASAGRPVALQPNAGAPRNTPDGAVYDATPAEMAALAGDLRDAGVRLVGGCCGTTPAHLAAIAATLS